MDLQTKFTDLKTSLSLEFVERSNAIEAITLALVAKQHLFFVGPPGVAKSKLIRRTLDHVGGLSRQDSMICLMMKSTTREEVLGPLNLPLFSETGRYEFLTDGYLPEVKFAFLDEIFKANSAILNALLMALNERQFKNDSKLIDIPLHSMFCASNELPEGEELAALYDRIPLRVIVDPIKHQANLEKIIRESLISGTDPNRKILDFSEIELAHDQASKVNVPDDVIQVLLDVKEDLRELNIVPTDRRVVQAIPFVQAAAWLDGLDTAEVEHLRALRYVFWDEISQYAEVEKRLLGVLNPLDKEASEQLAEIEKVLVELQRQVQSDLDNDAKRQVATSIYTKVKQIGEDVRSLEKRAEEGRRRPLKIDECVTAADNLDRAMLRDLFDMSPDEITQYQEEQKRGLQP